MKNSGGNIYKKEFIGSKIEVTDANHNGYSGIVGTVNDETKHTLIVQDQIDNKEKVVPKLGVSFKFDMDDHTYLLKGDKLNYRPEERIKKSG